MEIMTNELAGEKHLSTLNIYVYRMRLRRISLKPVIDLRSFNDKYISETM